MEQAVWAEIKHQAEQIERDCDKATARNSLAASFWNMTNLGLGLLAALFAAASATIVSVKAGHDASIVQDAVASGLASAAALVTAVLTFLKPSEKAAVLHQFAVKFRALREQCRIFKTLDCLPAADAEKLRETLDSILAKRDVLNAECPIVSNRTYRKARRIVEAKPQYRCADGRSAG